jgi:hypothetical protein
MTEAKTNTNVHSFDISVEGSKTGEKWVGKFTSKVLLSQADELNVDRRRRELLGANAIDASPGAQQRATIFAELWVRIIEAPSWWKDTAGGLELLDDEPVSAVFNHTQAAEAERLKTIRERAEKAKEALRAIPSPEG